MALIYVVLLWLGTAYWAFRDMQARTENPILPYFASALIIFFTPLLFVFAVVLYLIVRPRESLAEVYERSLAEEIAAGRGREERALPGVPRSGRVRLARLPELPHPAAPRLPVLQPAGRSGVAAVRLLRHEFQRPGASGRPSELANGRPASRACPSDRPSPAACETRQAAEPLPAWSLRPGSPRPISRRSRRPLPATR